ncbi:hypothetical protein BT69DRAFT_1292873 [Atractiella rhizophila]|nr:hypothetical protein BT69DRAFT_1292873 [Atractiella rhizophila]
MSHLRSSRKRSFYSPSPSPSPPQPPARAFHSINIARSDWLPTPPTREKQGAWEWIKGRRRLVFGGVVLFLLLRLWVSSSPSPSPPPSSSPPPLSQSNTTATIPPTALQLIKPTPVPLLRKARPPPTPPDPNEKYLSYLPHSGFHNQRISLENALSLSLLLNRTLLLPPVWLGTAIPYISYSKMYDRLRAASKKGLEGCKRERGLSRECVGYWDWTMVGWETFVDLSGYEEQGGRVVDWWEFSESWIGEKLGVERERSLSSSYKAIQKILQEQGSLVGNGDVFEVWDEKLYQFRISSVSPSTLSALSTIPPPSSPPTPPPTGLSSSLSTAEDRYYIYNKYLSVLPLSDLKERTKDHALLALGTLFGTTRLHFFPRSSPEYSARSLARKTMVFNNPGLKKVADEIASTLRTFAARQAQGRGGGQEGYWAVHLRVGDGKFREYKEKNALRVFGELLSEMGVSNATKEELVDRWRNGRQDGEEKRTDGKISRPFKLLKRLVGFQAEKEQQQEPKLVCRSPPHSPSHLLPFNRPLFIATDSPTLHDRALELFTTAFPCVFTLADFSTLQSYREVVEGWYVEADGVALGPMMPPFLDAMVAARGEAIAGTPESTFSKFATDVLWRVERGLEIVERG